MEASLVTVAMLKALFPKADQGEESKMYEAAVKKFNRYNISQDRILVSSEDFVYLLGKNKIHTKIGINELNYIIKCTQSSELIMRFQIDNMDIRMSFIGEDPEEQREDFLLYLKMRFANLVKNRALRFYGINEPNLKNYKQGAGFKNTNNSEAPAEEFRLKEEEIATADEHERQTEVNKQE